MTLEALIVEALAYSQRVQAIRTTPFIQETFIPEAAAEFDWTAFLESRFDDTSDPVGNTLTTGGSPRFRDHRLTSRGGLRRKTLSGGELELSQQVGYQDNNSRFFVPSQQGTGKLLLSFTQPLLNGAGKDYNESRIVLASFESEAARFEELELIRDHLLSVSRAYWNLYHARAVLLQKSRLHGEGQQILARLEARRILDAVDSQISRAQAAVASRRAARIRADVSLRNAETRLRTLINSPRINAEWDLELLPGDIPRENRFEVDLQMSWSMAMQNRPEFSKKLAKVRSASTRAGMAKQDLMPVLDLVMAAYVAGLEGQSDIPQAVANQYTVGEPGYSIGLLLEIPLGNRAAKSRYERRQLEVNRTMHEFQETVDTGMSEVHIAVREVSATWAEMQSRHESMLAAASELFYLTQRWEYAPQNDRVASLLLEQLLDAQDRLAAEEQDYVTAQVAYVLSILEWKRATGTLLQYLTASESPDMNGLIAPPVGSPGIAPSFPPANGPEFIIGAER